MTIQITGFNLVEGILWLLAFAWLVTMVLTLYGVSKLRSLPPLRTSSLQGEDAPLVSVIMPARNEASRVLAQSIRSVLAQDYGRLKSSRLTMGFIGVNARLSRAALSKVCVVATWISARY